MQCLSLTLTLVFIRWFFICRLHVCMYVCMSRYIVHMYMSVCPIYTVWTIVITIWKDLFLFYGDCLSLIVREYSIKLETHAISVLNIWQKVG